MIAIPEAVQARLDEGATTLARCWILRRADGLALGFTEHDAPLVVAGVTCLPDAAPDAGEARAEADAPGRGAIFGALDHAAITAEALDAGLWDGARVERHVADWTEPTLSWRDCVGRIGATTRTEAGYEAEVEGMSAALGQVVGRVFSARCDAELGDARCGVDLSGTAFSAAVQTLASRPGGEVIVESPAVQAPSGFLWGVLRWTSGPNAGAAARVIGAAGVAEGLALRLDPAPTRTPEPGDAARLVAGCDKRFETCRDRFANAANFRGCPHMPGPDALLRPVTAEARR